MTEDKLMLGNQDIDSSVITLEMTWVGINYERMKDMVGMVVPPIFLEVIDGTTLNAFISAERVKEFSKKVAAELTKNKELVEELKTKTAELTDEMMHYAKEKIKIVDKMTHAEMAEALLKMRTLQAECTFFGTAVAFSDAFGGITNQITDILNSKDDLKHPRYVYSKVLASPDKKSVTEKAVEDIRRSNKDEKTLIEEYFWLDQGYIGRGLTIGQLNGLKADTTAEDILPSKQELIEGLNLSKEELRLFEVSADLTEIKSLRADCRQALHVVINRIVDILAKEWKIEPKYVEALCANEVCAILEGKMQIPADIKERYVHSVLLPDFAEKKELLIGKDADNFIKQRLLKEELEDKEQVKGQVAYPGNITGPVKLVFGPQHLSKVKEGDVLVSIVTSPQLLPAMKTAAFITDMGGITSHAAIVARELKTPCVVGTRHATQILNDDDLVEVDADKGIIKIIKRK